MAKKKKKARLAKIRSLDFLRSIRLTEADTRTLREMFYEVNAHREQYDSLISAWQRFVDAQELIAGQLKYRDWEKINNKTLLSLAKGRFDLQDAVRNFLPKSLWVPDDDRRGLFFWHLFLKGFMQDDAELLRECSLCWQAVPFVATEIDRRAREPK